MVLGSVSGSAVCDEEGRPQPADGSSNLKTGVHGKQQSKGESPRGATSSSSTYSSSLKRQATSNPVDAGRGRTPGPATPGPKKHRRSRLKSPPIRNRKKKRQQDAVVAATRKESSEATNQGVSQGAENDPSGGTGEASMSPQSALSKDTGEDSVPDESAEIFTVQLVDSNGGVVNMGLSAMVTIDGGGVAPVEGDSAVPVVWGDNIITSSWEHAVMNAASSALTTDGSKQLSSSSAASDRIKEGSAKDAVNEEGAGGGSKLRSESRVERTDEKSSKGSQCEICGATVRVCHLLRHKQMHERMSSKNRRESNRNISCSICQRIFSRKYHLRRHMDTVHTTFPCRSCGMTFDQECAMNAHLEEVHGPTPGHYTCMICGTSFKERFDLIDHSSNHSSDGKICCPFCQEIHDDHEQLIAHLGSHSHERPYACRKCSETFPCSEELYKHQRVHGGKSPYQCPFCIKSYSTKRDVQLHEKLHLGGQYRCDICGKVFLRECHKVDHERLHKGEYTFICEICGRGFSNKHWLQNHLETHASGSDAVSCAICQELFANPNSLTVHMRKVHANSTHSLVTVADSSVS